MQTNDIRGDGIEPVPPWGKVPIAAASADLSKDAFRLLIVLASHADGRTRAAWPSGDRLARELGWISSTTGKEDRRRVSRAMTRLQTAGLVKRGRARPFGEAWIREWIVAPFPGVESSEGDESRASYDSGDIAEATSRMNERDESHDAYPAELYASTPLTDQEQTQETDQEDLARETIATLAQSARRRGVRRRQLTPLSESPDAHDSIFRRHEESLPVGDSPQRRGATEAHAS